MISIERYESNVIGECMLVIDWISLHTSVSGLTFNCSANWQTFWAMISVIVFEINNESET